MTKLLFGVVVLTATILGLPGAAVANARADSVRAWINRWNCANGYVDVPVTVMNDGATQATYRVSLAPGNWGSQEVTLAGHSKKPLPQPFRVMANGVSRIVLYNTSTRASTQIAIEGGAITCASMAKKTAHPPVKQHASPTNTPKKTQAPSTAGLGASNPGSGQSNGQHWLVWAGIFGLIGVAFLSASYEMWRRWPQA